jgi:hypothetical protein
MGCSSELQNKEYGTMVRRIAGLEMSNARIVIFMVMVMSTALCAADYYTEPQIYGMRPNPGGELYIGQIGVTGIDARIYKGVKVTVESTAPNTPAHGQFTKGEIIVGVNGQMLQGRNPLVLLGNALTEAEAEDGVLTFDVKPLKGDALKKVTITIPVLEPYSKTFPLNCKKSKAIIKQASEFYSREDRMQGHNLLNALSCLFLLSTGDDAYVPRVKAYFAQFQNPDGSFKDIGEHSWYNGYNGVACAEYYLRSGDQSVLPLIQYYCDDAKERQQYGVGWGHWGSDVNPAYESGGGMQHAAGNQILLTLVLGKVCGVQVDEKTLIGSLKHWYRFVGHGAIPIADQRYWHILRSAGRDGATAAVMQVASGATGDVTIYKKAKEYLAMSALTSWPARAYNWELIWHSLSGALMLDYDPDLYYRTAARFQWRFDLGRQASGAFFFKGDHASMSGIDSGISLGLAYTAPLKNLQINGAPRSKYAKHFTLPEHLWGTRADLAFLTSKHHKDFHTYGNEDEMHILHRQLPYQLRYSPADVRDLDLTMLLKNARHARCSVRMAAAKSLCMNERYGEIEALLRDSDPRLRRAGLDGIIDCRPWFTGPVIGKEALKAEQYTPAMIASINGMMSNSKEAWFVIDAALNALKQAPLEVLEKNLPNILPWTTVDDWWMRESAFTALMGFERDEALFLKHLPTIINIMINEYHYNPRHKMLKELERVMAGHKSDSDIGRAILAGFSRAALESKVLPDVGEYTRSNEGTVNIIEVALAAIAHAPESATRLATALAKDGRLRTLDTGSLMKVIKARDHGHLAGLYPALDELPAQERERLADTLYTIFRPELITRLQNSKERGNDKLMDMILDLTRLKKEVIGWQDIGTPKPEGRVWRFRSFDPLTEKEALHPRIGPPVRLREIALTADMTNWYKPEFDDSQWLSGKAPIGVGEFKAYGHGRGNVDDPNHFVRNGSDWGDGEFLIMRTTFDVTDLDFDYYRLKMLSNQGHHVYLNGHKVHTYVWFVNVPSYRRIMLTDGIAKHLKKGSNTLAIYSNLQYVKDKESDAYTSIGQMDLSIEGLKKEALGEAGAE